MGARLCVVCAHALATVIWLHGARGARVAEAICACCAELIDAIDALDVEREARA